MKNFVKLKYVVNDWAKVLKGILNTMYIKEIFPSYYYMDDPSEIAENFSGCEIEEGEYRCGGTKVNYRTNALVVVVDGDEDMKYIPGMTLDEFYDLLND